jgi:oligosaccharyltransferase complex subunit gamma
MLFLSYLTALLCTAGAAFAAKPKVDKFERFQSLSHGGSVELNDNTYNEITTAPRDYFTAVLLTAIDSRFGCVLCREFQPEWDIIARSWNKGQVEDPKMIFGTLDFTDGKETFKKVNWNIHRLLVLPDLTNCSLCYKLLPLYWCSRPLQAPTRRLMAPSHSNSLGK